MLRKIFSIVFLVFSLKLVSNGELFNEKYVVGFIDISRTAKSFELREILLDKFSSFTNLILHTFFTEYDNKTNVESVVRDKKLKMLILVTDTNILLLSPKETIASFTLEHNLEETSKIILQELESYIIRDKNDLQKVDLGRISLFTEIGSTGYSLTLNSSVGDVIISSEILNLGILFGAGIERKDFFVKLKGSFINYDFDSLFLESRGGYWLPFPSFLGYRTLMLGIDTTFGIFPLERSKSIIWVLSLQPMLGLRILEKFYITLNPFLTLPTSWWGDTSGGKLIKRELDDMPLPNYHISAFVSFDDYTEIEFTFKLTSPRRVYNGSKIYTYLESFGEIYPGSMMFFGFSVKYKVLNL